MADARKNPPAYLFALGHAAPPDSLTVNGVTWRYLKLFKHDFFAATALYEKVTPVSSPAFRENPLRETLPDGRVSDIAPLAVLKIQRTQHLFGLPLRWLGRLIANHEIRIYTLLQDIPGIPAFLGRYGATGFLHAFIPGSELSADMPLTPQFFDDLRALLAALHARHVAYVDTNKRENILRGDDGKPWLIDFQISYSPRKFTGWFGRHWLRRMQRADWYHYYKHKTRLLAQHCSAEDFTLANKRGLLHQLHRCIADPVRAVRRRFLSRYKLEKVK